MSKALDTNLCYKNNVLVHISYHLMIFILFPQIFLLFPCQVRFEEWKQIGKLCNLLCHSSSNIQVKVDVLLQLLPSFLHVKSGALMYAI